MDAADEDVRPYSCAVHATLLAAALVATLVGAGRERAEPTRAERLTPVIPLAPAPVPRSLPLVGPEKAGPYGYPLKAVDGPALRSLLQHRRFAELTAYVEELQAAFEQDFRREYWPSDASEALGAGDPELSPLLDEWARAHPRSFAPYLARGAHWVNRALAARGGRWAGETSREDFAAMSAALETALPDLDTAVALRPRLVAALNKKIQALQRWSRTKVQMRTVVDEATAACPECFQVRATYLLSLEPRWGGSYAQMLAYAAEAPRERNPKLALLPGYVDLDVRGADAHPRSAAIARWSSSGTSARTSIRAPSDGRGKASRAAWSACRAIASEGTP